MVKFFDGPLQVTPAFRYEALTVMVATTGAVDAFAAVKGLMFPLPFAASPMLVLLFVQE